MEFVLAMLSDEEAARAVLIVRLVLDATAAGVPLDEAMLAIVPDVLGISPDFAAIPLAADLS